jgi:hypothetical protein
MRPTTRTVGTACVRQHLRRTASTATSTTSAHKTSTDASAVSPSVTRLTSDRCPSRLTTPKRTTGSSE